MPPRFEAFQWHYYGFELPAGAELLAENDAARQAYRLGERTWGVQFHPEVTRHMLDHWFVEGAAELPDPAAVRRDTDLPSRHLERVRPAALQRLPRHAPPAEQRATRPAGRGSPTTRATSRRSSARRSPQRSRICAAIAERPPEWQ